MKILSVLFVAFVFLATAMPVVAGSTPYQSVVEVSDTIQALVNKERKSYTAAPKVLEEKVLKILTPVVDFDSIAIAVMAKHGATATTEQKVKFQNIFKNTLVSLYTKVLVEFEAASVKLDEASNKDVGAATSANVTMVVTSKDNKIYNINYAMRKTDGQWKVRNIVADGINLGLTYRNQFESAMNRYDNNIDSVIANWTREMATTKAIAQKTE